MFMVPCKTYRKSTVKHHATNCKPHTKPYSFYIEHQGVPLAKRFKKLVKHANNADLFSGITTMIKTKTARAKGKFEVAYWVAKRNFPITVYPKVLEFGEKH